VRLRSLGRIHGTGWKPDTALKLGDLHTVLAKRIAEEIKTP
jgi:hypothetical protein